MGVVSQGEVKPKVNLRCVEGCGGLGPTPRHNFRAPPGKTAHASDNRRYALWTKGISKGIPWEVMDKLPNENL